MATEEVGGGLCCLCGGGQEVRASSCALAQTRHVTIQSSRAFFWKGRPVCAGLARAWLVTRLSLRTRARNLHFRRRLLSADFIIKYITWMMLQSLRQLAVPATSHSCPLRPVSLKHNMQCAQLSFFPSGCPRHPCFSSCTSPRTGPASCNKFSSMPLLTPSATLRSSLSLLQVE